MTIRLLDPPLHEFLPDGDLDEIVAMLSADTGADEHEVVERIEKLAEINPMLGFRGCRLAITYPEIGRMQVRAILEAAVAVHAEGVVVVPDIMVPLVGTLEELKDQTAMIRETAAAVFGEKGAEVAYRIGTMIEIPRAALMSDQIATEAEFFSFGTNDLTQMTFGYSRDDVAKFLPTYLERGILQHDPFQVLDQAGVGQLIETSVKRGARRGRSSRWASAGSTAAIHPPSISFTARVSTTCPARRSACQSPDWRRRRRRSTTKSKRRINSFSNTNVHNTNVHTTADISPRSASIVVPSVVQWSFVSPPRREA